MALSHLWNAKRNSNRPPACYKQLMGLVSAMNTSPRQSAQPDEDAVIGDDAESDSDASVVGNRENIVVVVSDDEEGNFEPAPDIDDLYAVFFTPVRRNSKVADLTQLTPPSLQAATLF